MSFDLTSLRNWISETEADVQAVITAIKNEEAVIAKDIDAALHWIASNAPTIANEIEQVVNLVEAFGVVGNPEVSAAVEAANLAVQGLNAFAAASTSGKSDTDSVIAGYTAVKQAQSAVASATASAVAAPKT